MDYTALASADVVEKTGAALTAHGYQPIIVHTKEEALEKIKELIPAGSSVMNGTSTTLEQIGYSALLKSGEHKWRDLHKEVTAENDEAKRAELRRHAVVSDFYLGSAHAVSQTGELVIGSNSGSQLPHLAYTSPNIILVVSTQKIVPTLADALDRLENHVVPLEDARMQAKSGKHTLHSKTLILHKEDPAKGRKIYVILVNEKLGF